MSPHSAFPYRRRASVLIQAAVFGAVVGVGMMALAIDTGLMFITRGELQNAADAAALATIGVLAEDPDAEVDALRTTAQYFAEANHNVPGILADNDFVLGHWDTEYRVFTAGGEPTNAVRVVTRRSEANSNPLGLLFARIIGVDETDLSATAVAYVPVGVGFRGLIDDEMFDTDQPAIEALAASLGVPPGDLLSDNDGDRFIDLPAGVTLKLPTGQVGDEGLFHTHDDFPFTPTSSPSLEDFLLYDENGNRYGITDNDLDPLVGVDPVSDPADYPSFVDANQVLVSPVWTSDISPVWTSDISDTNPGVNAKGTRRGLVAYKIIDAGDDPPGSYLPSLTIEIVSPGDIDLDDLLALEDLDRGPQLVQ